MFNIKYLDIGMNKNKVIRQLVEIAIFFVNNLKSIK